MSVAFTAAGMAQGGYSPSTVLLVAWNNSDELARDPDKAKVRRCKVVGLVDGKQTLKTSGAGAHLTRAYLTGAYLTGANLTRADLTGAHLTGAKISYTTVLPEGFNKKRLI